MILDFAKERGPVRFAFIAICAVLFFWDKIIAAPIVSTTQVCMPFGEFVNHIIGSNYVLAVAVKVLLLLVCAYYLIIIFSIHDVLPQRKYLAAVLFLGITSVYTTAENVINVMLSSLFVMIAMSQIFETFREEKVKSNIFIAAFFIVVSSMFLLPQISAIISVAIGVWIYSVITGKNLVAMFFGIIAPLVITICLYHLLFHNVSAFFASVGNCYNWTVFTHPDFHTPILYFTCMVVLFTLFAIFKIGNSETPKVIYYKTSLMYSFAFVVAIIVALLAPAKDFSSLAIASIPAAYLIVRYTQLLRHTWIAELITFAIIFFVLYMNWM